MKKIYIETSVILTGIRDPRKVVEDLQDQKSLASALYQIAFWEGGSTPNCPKLGTAKIELTVDGNEATKQVVESLREAIVRQREESAKKINALEDQINRLLAIGHEPAKAKVEDDLDDTSF